MWIRCGGDGASCGECPVLKRMLPRSDYPARFGLDRTERDFSGSHAIWSTNWNQRDQEMYLGINRGLEWHRAVAPGVEVREITSHGLALSRPRRGFESRWGHQIGLP